MLLKSLRLLLTRLEAERPLTHPVGKHLWPFWLNRNLSFSIKTHLYDHRTPLLCKKDDPVIQMPKINLYVFFFYCFLFAKFPPSCIILGPLLLNEV